MPEEGDTRKCGSKKFKDIGDGYYTCRTCGCMSNFQPERCTSLLSFHHSFLFDWMAIVGSGRPDKEIHGLCVEGWYWCGKMVITEFEGGMSYADYKARWSH